MAMISVPVPKVPANGKSDRMPITGNFLEMQRQTGPLLLTVETTNGKLLTDRLPVTSSDRFPFEEAYAFVTLENRTGADISLDLLTGFGSHESDPTNLPPYAGSTMPTTADIVLAANTLTLLLAANPARRTAIVTAVAGTLRVGDGNTTAARGTPLKLDDTIALNVDGALYGFSAAGATVALSEIVT